MRVIILGGSNSIHREGWVAQLVRALPKARIVNLSVGAAGSMMGYFRLGEVDDLGPDDTVVWEYALNDENQLQSGRYADVARTVAHVEMTLRRAQDHRARFVPVVLRPRDFASNAVPSIYRQHLTALLARYGIEPVDPYALYATAHGGADVPEADYANALHLRADGEILGLAAARCAQRILTPGAPAIAEGAEPAGEVRIVTQFSGEGPVVFENSLMQRLVWQPRPQTRIIYRPEDGPWQITAVVTVSGIERAHFALRAGDDLRTLSAFHHHRNFAKPVLRMQDITNRAPFVVGPDRPLELIGWDEPGLKKKRFKPLGPLAEGTGLTGLLVERLRGAA